MQNVTNISLLFSHGLEVPQDVSIWCNQHEWNLATFKNMTGGEIENVVIIVEDRRCSLEVVGVGVLIDAEKVGREVVMGENYKQ